MFKALGKKTWKTVQPSAGQRKPAVVLLPWGLGNPGLAVWRGKEGRLWVAIQSWGSWNRMIDAACVKLC